MRLFLKLLIPQKSQIAQENAIALIGSKVFGCFLIPLGT